MKAYSVQTEFYNYQKYLVIADTMAEAEIIFRGKYLTAKIKGIELYSEHVQVQRCDEQAGEI